MKHMHCNIPFLFDDRADPVVHLLVLLTCAIGRAKTFYSIGPTYAVPLLDNTDYTSPPKGSLKFDDGEIIVYTCLNKSKYIRLVQQIIGDGGSCQPKW